MNTTFFDIDHKDFFEDIISKMTTVVNRKNEMSTSSLNEFWKYLQDCEAIFISKGYEKDANPDDIENMLSLHILNHIIPEELTKLLRELGLPVSKIEKEVLESHPFWDGWVYKNGTLFAFAKYCQLDPMWAVVLVYYFWYKHIHPGGVHKFIQQPNTGFNSSSSNGARIAIIGDWGTGPYKDGDVEKCPAQLVIDGIMKLDKVPDYIIHLGDVYYAGTKNEERENLINMLPPSFTGKLFTMNSNHEMYDGANGLFTETISNSNFKSQEGSSYFSLEVGYWIIVGLDSAYYDESHLYMDGAIFNKNGGQEQVDYLNKYKEIAIKEGKQLLVLTHHNPIEYDGATFVDSKKNEGSLWDQVVNVALKGYVPDAWYWGHIHNGIVYDLPELLQQSNNKLDIKLKPGENPRFRCCGHASIPYGKATGLFNKDTGKNNPGILYFGETAMNPPCPTPSQNLRVLNGFAVIDIHGAEFQETFYEVSNAYPDNKPNPIWESKPNKHHL